MPKILLEEGLITCTVANLQRANKNAHFLGFSGVLFLDPGGNPSLSIRASSKIMNMIW